MAAAGEAGETAALRIRGLKAAYGEKVVLDGLDLDVHAGELVTLLGANGSGKSTALRCLVGLRDTDGGVVLLDGAPLGERGPQARRRVAMVFQQPQLIKRRTVIDNVCSGALGRLSLRESAMALLFPTDVREQAMRCLDRVGLADRAADKAGRLSGGQQQRVAVARALCQEAPLLLADEPVSALDPASAEQVLALLADLAHTDGLAVLAVLHQPDLARKHSDRIVGLLQGRMLFAVTAKQATTAMVDSLYVYENTVPEHAAVSR